MRKKKGFTLIELLVVVAIIAVLVALLLPALAKARSLARQALCSSRLKQNSLGIMYYAQEYNDFLVPAVESTAGATWGSRWQKEIGKSIANMDLTTGAANMPKGDFWLCPETNGTSPTRPWANWYGYNACGTNNDYNPNLLQIPYRITSYNQPTRFIVITDSWEHLIDYSAPWTWVVWRGSSDPRHNQRCNILWLDLHVTALPKNDFVDDVNLWRNN